MIPSHQPVNEQGIKELKPLYNIDGKHFSELSPDKTVNNLGNKDSKAHSIKEEESAKSEQPLLLTQTIDNDLSLLTPLKAPKSYGTYSKQQQEDVIAFIKDGHSLRTAEKVFRIPKSTMHCWLKKLHIKSDVLNTMKVENYSDVNVDTSYPYNNDPAYTDESDIKVKPWKDSHSYNPPRKISPTSPIVIEEADLIRFLQSNEGIEMIAKSFCIGANDFVEFVNKSRTKSQESFKGLHGSSVPSRPVDVTGVLQSQKKSLDVKDNVYYQQVSPNTARKRNLYNFNFDKISYPGVAVLEKKIKVEQSTQDSASDGYIKNTNNNLNTDGKNRNINRSRKKSNSKNNSHNFGLNDNINKSDYNNSNVINNSSSNSSSITISSIGGNNNNSNSNSESNSNNNHSTQNRKNNDLGNTGGSSSSSSSNNRVMNSNPSNSSLLASLLSKDSDQKAGMQKKVVLNTEQSLAGNKILNCAPTDLLHTHASRRFLLNTLNSQGNDDNDSKSTLTIDHSPELSFGYSKVSNPVSIKAERLDSEIALPCNVSPNNGGMHHVRTLSPVVHSITKPVVTSNNSATLNLNIINRTQSEKELMAMVDGDNVSADELCAEFKETLELSKWVDNETWYMDQYLQHFQVSPALTSPNSSLTDADADDLDDEVNSGLTFAVDKDRERKLKNSSHTEYDHVNKLSPVTVKIFEPSKNTGEVWSTLSSPGLSSSPHSRDGLLTSPRIYDGLLCSPPQYQIHSPRKEQLLTQLQESGLDPNLIQPNFNSNLNNR